MTRPIQPPLIVVARTESRFDRETRRRGGPAEISVKRWRGLRVQRRDHELSKISVGVPFELPRLGKMR